MQNLALRYTERPADERAVASVGTKGDSLDNALAETVDGLCKTELIYRQGLWKTMEQVETSDNLVDQLVERVAPLRGLRLGASSEVRGEPLPSPGRGPVGRVKPNNRASIKS